MQRLPYFCDQLCINSHRNEDVEAQLPFKATNRLGYVLPNGCAAKSSKLGRILFKLLHTTCVQLSVDYVSVISFGVTREKTELQSVPQPGRVRWPLR